MHKPCVWLFQAPNSYSARVSDDSLKFLRKHFGYVSAMKDESSDNTFDAYAEDYDVALARGISVSGERKDYFTQRRVG